MPVKHVRISQAAFSKVVINKEKLVAPKAVLHRNAHKLLEEWLNQSGGPRVGDGILFEVVRDSTLRTIYRSPN